MPRSRSRGRKSPARTTKPSPVKKPKVESAMDFNEGSAVMARWPGTNLYFKASVKYVRPDDGEYDVQYEDGTVFTIKAKDVRKGIVKAGRKTTPSRSLSRGRSPGRRRSPARTKAEPKASPKTPVKEPEETPKLRDRKPRAAKTSSSVLDQSGKRASARIAAKYTEMSSDDERPKLAPNPDHPRRGKGGLFGDWNFDWLKCLFFTGLGGLVMISLHTLCNTSSCKPAIPNLPKSLPAYWDKTAFLLAAAFIPVVAFFTMIPVGSEVKAVNGHYVRMNGFLTLLTCLSAIPALVYAKVNLAVVTNKYFYLMISSLILAVLRSAVAYGYSLYNSGRKSNKNPKGNTGNIIVDFFYGNELNPFFFKIDFKLQTFRLSMIALATLNAVMAADYAVKNNGVGNPVILLSAVFQIVYAMDALLFEQFYFFSHDAMNTGYGCSLILWYHSFPFLPTLITRYLISKPAITMPWYYLVFIAMVNIISYLIFRLSENQRCNFNRDPDCASLKHIETISATSNKKILAGGWWSFVRYPNYLGEILIQWSWVLPAACTAGKTDLLVYYFPLYVTLVILVRCSQQNTRNRRKYGLAWDTYTRKVKSNIIPKIY